MRNAFQVWVPQSVSLQISWQPIWILIVKMFAQKFFMLNIFLTFSIAISAYNMSVTKDQFGINAW